MEEKTPDFQKLCTKWNLDVDRKAEEIIYSQFHSNDIKSLFKALPDFAGIPLSKELCTILKVLFEFDKWSRMMLSAGTDISDTEAAALACKDLHPP